MGEGRHRVRHRGPLRIIRSSSFEEKQRLVREAVLRCHGARESVAELGGILKGADIVITDALIPRAWIGHANFYVEDRDLSACWAEAEKSGRTSHLKPVGDLHYHPGDCRHLAGDGPRPSHIDETNSLRQASLYVPFTRQVIQEEQVLAPELGGEEQGVYLYRIDRSRSVLLRCLAGMPELSLTFRERRFVSRWASLIYASDGCPEHVSACVTTHEYRDGELRVLRHEDVPTAVLPDEEIAELTGWPLERIRLPMERDLVEREVREKYETDGYGWPAWHYDSWNSYKYDSRYPAARFRPAKQHWSSSDRTRALPKWEKQEFCYLSAEAAPADVAQVLREAAAVVSGEGSGAFEYFHGKAATSEVTRALEECLRLLRKDKHEVSRYWS
jgi:hypothetical protein